MLLHFSFHSCIEICQFFCLQNLLKYLNCSVIKENTPDIVCVCFALYVGRYMWYSILGPKVQWSKNLKVVQSSYWLIKVYVKICYRQVQSKINSLHDKLGKQKGLLDFRNSARLSSFRFEKEQLHLNWLELNWECYAQFSSILVKNSLGAVKVVVEYVKLRVLVKRRNACLR